MKPVTSDINQKGKIHLVSFAEGRQKPGRNCVSRSNFPPPRATEQFFSVRTKPQDKTIVQNCLGQDNSTGN